MAIATVGNRVIIKPIMQEKFSEGGIEVAESFRGRSAKGEVVAVGPKVDWLPIGSVCHYVKGGGDKIELDNKEYYALLDIDVRAFYVN